MQTVKVEINVPQETKEVADALTSIIADIRAKKSVMEIASGNLTKLYQAVEGVDKMDDEMKTANRSDAAGYLVKGMMDVLLPVKVEAVAVEVTETV